LLLRETDRRQASMQVSICCQRETREGDFYSYFHQRPLYALWIVVYGPRCDKA
jgi:hypothetical protein